MQNPSGASLFAAMPSHGRLHYCLIMAVMFLISTGSVVAEFPGFQQTLTVSLKYPVLLDISVDKGNVAVEYSHDGLVSIYATAVDSNGKSVPRKYFETNLKVEQSGNHVTIQGLPNSGTSEGELDIHYQIDVPSRTEVNSSIADAGNQTVVGIKGPVNVTTNVGDIDIFWIFGHVKALTNQGKISCSRVDYVDVETGAGNISLLEDGASKAKVRKGFGRIDVGGARGPFTGSTDKGDLNIKAVLWDDWHLTSASGNIRIELPPHAQFRADVATLTGEVLVERKRPDDKAEDCQCRAAAQDGSPSDRTGKHMLCEQKASESILSTEETQAKEIMARSEAGNIFLD